MGKIINFKCDEIENILEEYTIEHKKEKFRSVIILGIKEDGNSAFMAKNSMTIGDQCYLKTMLDCLVQQEIEVTSEWK